MVDYTKWEHYISKRVTPNEMRLRYIEDPTISIGIHTDNDEQFEASWPVYIHEKRGVNYITNYTFGDEHDTVEEAIKEAEEEAINWESHIIKGDKS